MNCVEAKRMVTRFVNKELTYQELEQFLRHVEHCADCMDELDIYFTMYKAFDMLDTGSHQEYDFKKMLREELHAAWRRVVLHRIFRVLRDVFVAVLILLMLFGVYYVVKYH